MVHEIQYNKQIGNLTFAGKFKSFWQCFTTSSWMFMSFYSKNINGVSDKGLANYLDDVEIGVGKPGIAERIVRKFNMKVRKGSSYWWVIQQAGIQKWLSGSGVNGECIFVEHGLFEILPTLLLRGPVILQTRKMGGLKGGHIILIVGYDDGFYICHDPFGDANHYYKEPINNGENVWYDEDFLKKYTGDKIRYIIWR